MGKSKFPSLGGPSLGRHQRGCRICAHPHRTEIESCFIAWRSPAAIAREYHLRDRATVYRHAHALDLFAKRARNVRAALERMIEQVDTVKVTAPSVVQAIVVFARISTQGQLIEPKQQGSLHDLFARMSRDELGEYARNGSLPHWFSQAVGATQPNSHGGGKND